MVLGSLALLRFERENSAESRLYRAAAAAVEEAMLPRASRTTVAFAAQRTLARENSTLLSPGIELRINSRAATSHWIDCRSGDVVSVTLTAVPPSFAANLLRWLGIRSSRSPLRVTATVQKP